MVLPAAYTAITNFLGIGVRQQMKKRLTSVTQYELIVAVCFLLGGILGVTMAGKSEIASLQESVKEYINSSQGGYSNIFLYFTNLLNLLKYPLILFLFGFTIFGIGVIPVVVGIKGYALAFAFSTYIRVFDHQAIQAILISFGLQSVLSLPCIFLMAICGLQLSWKLFHMNFLHTAKARAGKPDLRLYITYFIICLFVLFLTALIDTFIIPQFLSQFQIA